MNIINYHLPLESSFDVETDFLVTLIKIDHMYDVH